MTPPLLSPRTATRTARALARCLLATERSASVYARAARTLGATSDVGTWLEHVAAEREGFAAALRDLLTHMSSVVAASGSPDVLLPGSTCEVLGPSGDAPRELLASCDATDLEAQRVYEVCRSELARVDVPRDIRRRIDAQYAAVCNARFDLDRFVATPLHS